MREEAERHLSAFIDEWVEVSGKNKEIFLRFRKYLSEKPGVTLDFIARPGVTYSLRAGHVNQKDRGLFVMVDVIEDASRWLSVCFYSDMIVDPEKKGDLVPEGLLGEDALCFDMEQPDELSVRYLESCLDEACDYAARQ